MTTSVIRAGGSGVSVGGELALRLAASGTLTWWGLLVLGTPWLRLETPHGQVYPLLTLVGLIALATWLCQWWRERNGLPLIGLWVACCWIGLMVLIRGEFTRAGMLATAVLPLAGWALWAHRVGLVVQRTDRLMEGLLIFVITSIAYAGFSWGLVLFWPVPCALLHCPVWPYDPPLYTGGWLNPAQYSLLMFLVLPVVLAALVLAWREPRAHQQRWVLASLLSVLGLGALVGGSWWLVPIGIVLWLGVTRALAGWREPRDRVLLRNLTVWMLVVPAGFYAIFPAYFWAWDKGAGKGSTQVKLVPTTDEPPRDLSSVDTTWISLTLTNTGSVGLPASVKIIPRLFLTPDRGKTRIHDLKPVPLSVSVRPQASVALQLPLRLPPWVRDGFLGWVVRTGSVEAELSADSQIGWRVVNRDHEQLLSTEENRLSTVAAEARSLRTQTAPPPPGPVTGHTWERMLGESLDTLFFSPIWGEQKAQIATTGGVFSEQHPFLPAIFAEFGLVGLVLVLRILWVTARRVSNITPHMRTARGHLIWQLLPIPLIAVLVLALVTGALGTYHAQWGLFLLFGFVEGRHNRLYPPRPSRRWPGLGGLRMPRLTWPRFRLPLLGHPHTRGSRHRGRQQPRCLGNTTNPRQPRPRAFLRY